jgi:hypothetical protein
MTRSVRLPGARTLAALMAVGSLAAIAPGSAGAEPVQYNPDDPWYMTEPCAHDTSPTYPSCGGVAELAPGSGSGAAARIQYRPDDPWFTTKPCKHDTSPSYPSCGGAPRGD